MKRMMVLVTAVAAFASPALTAGTTQNQNVRTDHAVRRAGDRITSALNLLEAKGYTKFTNFEANGADYTATVTRDGRSFTVRVNPDSEKVTQIG